MEMERRSEMPTPRIGHDLELVLEDVASVNEDEEDHTGSTGGCRSVESPLQPEPLEIRSRCAEMFDMLEAEHMHFVKMLDGFMASLRHQALFSDGDLADASFLSLDASKDFCLRDDASRSTASTQHHFVAATSPRSNRESRSTRGTNNTFQRRSKSIRKTVFTEMRDNLHRAFQKAEHISGDTCVQASWAKFLDATMNNEFLLRRRLNLKRLESIVDHKMFRMFVLVVITANLICMGVEISENVRDSFQSFDARVTGKTWTPSDSTWTAWMDVIFVFIYCIELSMRVLAKEGSFFFGVHGYWNIFDACVVLIAVLELILKGNTASSNPVILRLLRLLRLTRTVRSIRLLQLAPWLYSLQLLLISCKNSLAALMWSSLVLGLVLFVFAMAMVSGTVAYVDRAELVHSAHVETLRLYFSSLPAAMLTLFITFLGEVNFQELIAVLQEVHHFYAVAFIVFVLFSVLALTNVISGIFVTDTMELSQQDREIRHRGEQARARKNMQVLRKLFREMDQACTGQLSRDVFDQQCHRADVQALFSFFKFDIVDAGAFFTLLDVDGDGMVDLEEFVVGCLRVYGKSNAIDMEINVHDTKNIAARLEEDMTFVVDSEHAVLEELERVHHVLAAIMKSLDTTSDNHPVQINAVLRNTLTLG